MAIWDALFGVVPSMLINQQAPTQSVQQQYPQLNVQSEPLYTPIERTTSENFSGKNLETLKKLKTDEERLAFAKKKFGAPGQTVKSVTEGGLVKMDDYFKAYPTLENFNQDMANLLAKHQIGVAPMNDEEYGKNLQSWYATYTRQDPKTKKTYKAYAEDLVNTKARANAVRSVVLDPKFQQLNPQQQYAFLSSDNLIHNSFKSDELRKAEKDLENAKKLKATGAMQIAQEKIDLIKSSGAGVNPEKVSMMLNNMQQGWESAKSISEKLNNNVSPEILFTQMAMETKYFTKPVAENNLTSIKITGKDRAKLKFDETMKRVLP